MISYPLAVGHTATRVLEAGSGGKVVVLIHGTGGRADRWVRNIDAVASSGLHVYAVDLPGHGFASKGEGIDCSVPAYARFIAEFMDAMQIAKATIVGTSLGGHAVARFALDHPERVDGLVLVGSMGLVPIGDEARARVQAGANNQSREGVATKFRRVIHDAALVTPEMEEEEFRVNNSAGAKESFATLGRYVAERLDQDVVGADLARLDKPVMLVWGDEDKTVPPATGEQARAALSNSRLVRLAGAAHTAYFERPDDFNRILVDFVAGKGAEHQAPGVVWK